MDTEIKHKYPLLKKYGWWAGAGVAVLGAIVLAVAASGDSTYNVDADAILTGDVTQGFFDDYVRINGRVETGIIV